MFTLHKLFSFVILLEEHGSTSHKLKSKKLKYLRNIFHFSDAYPSVNYIGSPAE